MSDLSLESLFGESEIEIDCPSCETIFQVTFKEVINSGSIVSCSECGQEIEITHDETTTETLENSEKALKKFNKALDDF